MERYHSAPVLLYSMRWPSFETIGHGPVKDAMAVMYKAYRAANVNPTAAPP